MLRASRMSSTMWGLHFKGNMARSSPSKRPSLTLISDKFVRARDFWADKGSSFKTISAQADLSSHEGCFAAKCSRAREFQYPLVACQVEFE